VFGSRATWTAKAYSDLDLAIITDMRLPLATMADLKTAFDESDLSIKVDIVDWATTAETFKDIIRKTAMVVHEGNIRKLEGWSVRPLEECMAAIIDYRGKTPDKTTSGIPLITAKVVKGGRIEPTEEYIAIQDYDSWMRRGIPQVGDVVMTTEAPLGEVAQLGTVRVALAQRLITLRGKPSIIDNTFLKFLMQSSDIQDQLRARASGTTVLGIKQSELRKVNLTLPPLSEQHAIAHILGTLDDKIELNRRMNETLEAMARALFKSWFVDFEPVRAKAERRDTGLAPEIADLFPDSFEDTELGEVPKDWSVGTLGDVANNQRRGIQPDAIVPETPYIGLEHMPRRCIALSDWGQPDALESNKYEFKRGEMLFGKLRPYFHIVVITPKNQELFGFVLGHISSNEFVEYTNAGSTGTKMPRTNWNDMVKFAVVIPPITLAARYTEMIQPMIDRISVNIHESRSLAAQRDTLLPKLLSGELAATEAE
jgi:type I restriction enzyme S subunit